ncbi:hypothetical protein EMCG_03763 [[Emmonsia] crescens]|uniref:Protein kinase domain-containing protein n=1 Tax=[Emmonsia] crescens TaxID=73230 RepID=A0A0G2IZT3_9EURO|nr:hypothetical protein EMCG_03763 [Emmonsia crescens UAMH 3008]
MAGSVKAKQFLLSELSVMRLLYSSDSSKIFLVKHEGMEYCLKVFHVNKDPGFTSKGRDLCHYCCEIEAYKLLSAAICKQGFVPQLHALFEDIDPLTPMLTPHLNIFLHDLYHPCAILLEYLLHAKPLNCENYTQHRIKKAILGIQAVHCARVVHNDPYLKNVLIVPGMPSNGIDDRVVWIDFDIALNFGSMKVGWLKYDENVEAAFEKRLVESYGKMLEEDRGRASRRIRNSTDGQAVFDSPLGENHPFLLVTD